MVGRTGGGSSGLTRQPDGEEAEGMGEPTKVTLDEAEIPRHWYNLVPDLPPSAAPVSRDLPAVSRLRQRVASQGQGLRR
jgi:hypothetical protein